MAASNRLKQVFIDTLGLSAEIDVEKLKYRSIPEWDSIAHMQLVMEIENAFGVMLPTDDVINLSSFEKAKEILAKHGITTSA